MNRAEIKAAAKEQLGRNIFGNAWMMALLACLIFTVVTGVAGTIIPGIGAVIIFGPMNYGLSYLFLKQGRDGQPMNLGDIFSGFTYDFSQTFLIGLMTTIFTALWSLLLFIPGIVKTYAYSLVYYIKADHPEYDWRTCISESQRIMKGHKWEMFVLDLSFIGWYIVGSLCLGVGDLWVAPYHIASRTQMYLRLVGESVNVNKGPEF